MFITPGTEERSLSREVATMDLRLMACVAAAGCLLLLGCGQEFSASNSGGAGGSGAGSGTGSAGSPSSGGGSSVGGGNCEDGLLHAPPVPEPWQGPFAVAVADGTTSLRCATPAVQLYDGLIKTEESCECSCGEDLSKCAGFMSEHQFDICNSPPTSYTTLPHGICVPTLVPMLNGELGLHIEPLPDVGVCVSETTESFGSDWQRTVELCGVSPGQDGCTSVPDAYDKTLCIQLPSSDAACPAKYQFGCTLYQGVDDQRDCNDASCSCNDINVYCDGSIDGYSDNQCLNPTNAQECMPFNQAPMQLRYMADLEGECVVTGEAVVEGEILEAGPTRVCCTEPSDICSRR